MNKLRELTVEEVTAILSKGTFADLISTVEHVQFECKSGFYDTKADKGKIELAKDISALGNSRGGYLLIGPATKSNPLHHRDEVVSISEFSSSTFNPESYRDILKAYIYPPISDLKIQWHPSSIDPSKGIASIYVPPQSVNEKPYLVVKSEVGLQVLGHHFGYFERSGDEALPTTVQVLRDTLKDGRRYGDLERRMESLESLLGELVSKRPLAQDLVPREVLLQRAADASVAAQLSDIPSFFLIAAPTELVRLSGLFSVMSSEYAAISKPPEYRQYGFDLDTDTSVQFVRGEAIRRVLGGRKLLELWQDGTLVFVGRNDEDFLGWSVKRKAKNIYIHNFVLTEVVLLFFALTIQIFSNTKNPPEKVRACFGFLSEENDGATYELSPHPVQRGIIGCPAGKEVSAENKSFWIDFNLRDAIPEVEALGLLKEIYHWFGIADEQIPYIVHTADPNRVDRSLFKD